jgi:hypothetical protein
MADCCEPGKETSGSGKGVRVTVSVSRRGHMSSTALTEEALIICPRYDCYAWHYQDIQHKKLQRNNSEISKLQESPAVRCPSF